MSPSTRRAWIEIQLYGALGDDQSSPSTRRAWIEIGTRSARSRSLRVALHPEGVDRNFFGYDIANLDRGSPSTRRAWIEIMPLYHAAGRRAVALHPEGVDRNQ